MKSREKRSRELLGLSIITVFIIALLHSWALESYLYWVYSWFDILVHFLGGFWVVVTSLWLYLSISSAKERSLEKEEVFWISFVVVLVIGIFWEVFELFLWQTYEEPQFLVDTLSDLVADVSGGILAYRYFIFYFLEKNN